MGREEVGCRNHAKGLRHRVIKGEDQCLDARPYDARPQHCVPGLRSCSSLGMPPGLQPAVLSRYARTEVLMHRVIKEGDKCLDARPYDARPQHSVPGLHPLPLRASSQVSSAKIPGSCRQDDLKIPLGGSSSGPGLAADGNMTSRTVWLPEAGSAKLAFALQKVQLSRLTVALLPLPPTGNPVPHPLQLRGQSCLSLRKDALFRWWS